MVDFDVVRHCVRGVDMAEFNAHHICSVEHHEPSIGL
jgi:hypothetical protein